MLAEALALDAGVQNYHRSDHPMQVIVKGIFEDLAAVKPDEVNWAVDGYTFLRQRCRERNGRNVCGLC